MKTPVTVPYLGSVPRKNQRGAEMRLGRGGGGVLQRVTLVQSA